MWTGFPGPPLRKVFLAWSTRMAGPLGDGGHGLPQGLLVEGRGAGGLGGQRDHLLPSFLGGLLAPRVVTLEDSGLLAAMATDAGEGVK